MSDDRQEQQLSAEVVAQQGFGTSRRGFDRDEVRAFLSRVAEQLRATAARERQLQIQLRDAEERAAHPDIDEASMFGEETARILRSAQEAAADIRAKAEEHAQKVLEDAHQQATAMRQEAEGILDARTQEAASAAEALRREADQEAERMAARAQAEAEALMATVNARAQTTVQEAEARRDRVLNDLARRRLVAATQVEQLRAGRERLLDAYRTVRRTLEEVTDDLQRADAEARAAAEAAGRRPPPPEAVTEAYPPAREPEPAAAPEAAAEPEPTAESEPVAPPEAAVEPEAAGEAVGTEEPPALDIVEPPSADEGVRIIRPESTPARPVDEVFARIRADRAGAVDEAAPAEAEEPADAPEAAVTDADEARLQQREVALEKVEASLARKLKRALQDEQNELLDRLRGLKAKPAANLVLPDASAHAERYAEASRELLGQAAAAGSEIVGTGDGPPAKPSLDDLASELAIAIVDPLRRRLERAFTDGHDDDPSVLAERLGAAYREWKTQRIEQVAADHVVAAFTRGTFAALPEGTTVRWVVCDVDGPCPDCDDNALAGALPKGEAFPTGQLYPPAHAGCHCLLAVEVVPAD